MKLRTFHLYCHLAEKAGYEPSFQDNEDGTITDAECNQVPSLPDLCLRNPELVGHALRWITEHSP